MFKTPRKCLRSFLCSSIIFSDNWQFSEARLSRKLNYVLNKHHFLPPPPSFYYYVRVILYSGLKQIQNEIQFRSVWSSWTAESFHLAVNFHSRLCVFWIVGRVTKCEILTPSLTGYLVKNLNSTGLFLLAQNSRFEREQERRTARSRNHGASRRKTSNLVLLYLLRAREI